MLLYSHTFQVFDNLYNCSQIPFHRSIFFVNCIIFSLEPSMYVLSSAASIQSLFFSFFDKSILSTSRDSTHLSIALGLLKKFTLEIIFCFSSTLNFGSAVFKRVFISSNFVFKDEIFVLNKSTEARVLQESFGFELKLLVQLFNFDSSIFSILPTKLEIDHINESAISFIGQVKIEFMIQSLTKFLVCLSKKSYLSKIGFKILSNCSLSCFVFSFHVFSSKFSTFTIFSTQFGFDISLLR